MGALTLAACTNEDWGIEMNTDEVVQSSTRSYEEAVLVARNAIGMLGDAATRSGEGRSIDFGNVKYLTSASTRNGGSDTLLYIFNYADEAGFAVVSANKATEPLLAVTEQGSYDPATADADENGGFAMFMDMAEGYVSTMSTELPITPGIGGEDFMQYRNQVDTLTLHITPKITVQWEQGGYEGAFAPNKLAGCSNVAMAQIMSYFCYPTQMNITYPGASVSSLSLNWSDIKVHKISDDINPYCTASSATHTAIGHLHRQLGHLNGSVYNDNGGTSTVRSNVKNTFSNLGYNASALRSYARDSFQVQLNSDKLIYMGGQRYDTLTTGETKLAGHAWVVDGLLKHTITDADMVKYDYESEWRVLDKYVTYNNYLHINWGFHGACNGYFSIGVFYCKKGYQYDNSGVVFDNSMERNYQYNIQYMEISKPS